ncbi:hypothetical protein [Acetobacter estunensis]|uniref:hypothetical protein n=1 Tax=Acetobacter estunensis TaxID=104097 RepID=UPI001C2CD80F|nr:hypothetical protein [Acetobacter estunensis]MBV1835894.1 hypothetical protein [Acetobacter estunensis]
MRLRILAMPVMAAGFLAGCTHGPAPVGVHGTPDPYRNVRNSAVCQTTPPVAGPNGALVSTMTVRSDDGRCVLSVTPPDGGAYASFGVSPEPEHGKAFLYGLDGHTQIAYTPTLGYAGNDTFTTILIRGPGQKRDTLIVNATVDATGVAVPKPAVTAPETKKVETKAKTTTRRRVTSAARRRR